MVKELACADAGYDDCSFMIRDENEDELVEIVQMHAKGSHDTDLDRTDVEGLMHEA